MVPVPFLLTAVVDEIGDFLAIVELVFLEDAEPHDLPGEDPAAFLVPGDFLPFFGAAEPGVFLETGVPDFLFNPVFLEIF